MLRALPTIAKAIAAAAAAAGAALTTALLPDAAGVSAVTGPELATIIVAALGALGAVYAVPNAVVPPTQDNELEAYDGTL